MPELLRARFQGVVDGRPVDLYTLRNQSGMSVRISNFGARIQQVLVPDRTGRMADVVLGYDSLADVMKDTSWLGAFVGRYANRIGGAGFTLNGQSYTLSANDGGNTLHGGALGCSARVFDVLHVDDGRLVLFVRFRSEDDGFPGTLDLTLTYTVDADNALVVAWEAKALDQPTLASFTSHAYFNLSGVPGSNVLDHEVCIHANGSLEIGEGQIPTGHVKAVEGTPFDLRLPQALSQTPTAGAYDHYWVTPRVAASAELQLQAHVRHAGSGRTLETWSTEPGVQFYTGGWLGSGDFGQSLRDKNGQTLVRYGALCLEPSAYPDAPNHPHFPDTTIAPGASRTGKIVYRFGVT